MSGCEILNNTATNYGGGIYCYFSNPAVSGCTFSSNTANDAGGGIYCRFDSNPTLTDCVIEGNIANYDGGGIYCSESDPTLTDTVVCGNSPDQIIGTWIDNGGNDITDECPSDCIGDFDASGSVNTVDLLTFLAAYQLNSDGDCDDDGDTDVDDLLILTSAWGPCP